MSYLKEKLEDYSVQPDESVWSSIENTMHTRTIVRRRRAIICSTALVIGGVIAAVSIFGISKQSNEELTVAQNSQPTSSAVVNENSSSSHTTPNVTAISSQSTTLAPVTTTETSTSTSAPTLATIDESETVVVAESSSIVSVPEKMNEAKNNTKLKSDIAQQTVATPSLPQEKTSETVGIEEKRESQGKTIASTQSKVSNDELAVWIPNAFAPDDPNDDVRTFKVRVNSEANLVSFEIFIYSRSGRQVYHSKDVNAGWDGTANGQAQPMGTYVYIIELNDAVKGLQHQKGTITLIR